MSDESATISIHDFITHKLDWLPVRIRFKILVPTFQTYHGVAPYYLRELITKHHAVRALRSYDMMIFDEPKIQTKTYDGMTHECLFIRRHVNNAS